MTTLGTLRGTGALRSNGEEAPVEYRLAVVHQRYALSEHGSLGGDMRAIHRTFERGGCVLVLEDGGEVRIIIDKIAVGRSATFLTNGRNPGGWENMI